MDPAIFVLQMHHAIFDGWCTMLLILDALYKAAYQKRRDHNLFALFQPFIKRYFLCR